MKETFTLVRRRLGGKWAIALGPDATLSEHRKFAKKFRGRGAHPEYDRVYRLTPRFRLKLDAPPGMETRPAPKAPKQAIKEAPKAAEEAPKAPAQGEEATNAPEAQSEPAQEVPVTAETPEKPGKKAAAPKGTGIKARLAALAASK